MVCNAGLSWNSPLYQYQSSVHFVKTGDKFYPVFIEDNTVIDVLRSERAFAALNDGSWNLLLVARV